MENKKNIETKIKNLNNLNWKNKIIWLSSFALILIFCLRLTIIGQFFDDVFFRFFFGWTRWIIYLLIFQLITFLLLKIKIKALTSANLIIFLWFFINLIWFFGLIGMFVTISIEEKNIFEYKSYLIQNNLENFKSNWNKTSIFAISKFEFRNLLIWNNNFFVKTDGGGLFGLLIAGITSFFYFLGSIFLLILSSFFLYSWIRFRSITFYLLSKTDQEKILWKNLNQNKDFKHWSGVIRKIKNEDFTMELPTSQKIMEREWSQQTKFLDRTLTKKIHENFLQKKENEKIKTASWEVDFSENTELLVKNKKDNLLFNKINEDEDFFFIDEDLKNYFNNDKLNNLEILPLRKGLPDPKIWKKIEKESKEKINANLKKATENREKLNNILRKHYIESEIVNFYIGPSVTKYELKLNENVEINSIIGLQKKIEQELGEKKIRMVASTFDKNLIGIEIINSFSTIVHWVETLPLLNTKKNNLKIGIGKNIYGKMTILELEKLPHLLITGSIGSGKSVSLSAIITSLIYQKTSKELKIFILDFQENELSIFKKIPHLISPIITDPKLGKFALQKIIDEINQRKEKMKIGEEKNIENWNKAFPEKFIPQIVVIINELVDLTSSNFNKIEKKIIQIGETGHMFGIHLIAITQHPSNEALSNLIKKVVPGRMTFNLANQFDSKTILGQNGAELLNGRGDMLYLNPKTKKLERIQGVFIDEKEIEIMNQFWINKKIKNSYWKTFENLKNEKIINKKLKKYQEFNDELYSEIKNWVKIQKNISVYILQRKFGIEYDRSERICEQLEYENIVGPITEKQIRIVYKKNINQSN